jgi:hypothetical protein
MESCWQETAMVAWWHLVAVVESKHGWTATVGGVAAIAARIAAVKIVDDCPSSVAAVVGVADP